MEEENDAFDGTVDCYEKIGCLGERVEPFVKMLENIDGDAGTVWEESDEGNVENHNWQTSLPLVWDVVGFKDGTNADDDDESVGDNMEKDEIWPVDVNLDVERILSQLCGNNFS